MSRASDKDVYTFEVLQYGKVITEPHEAKEEIEKCLNTIDEAVGYTQTQDEVRENLKRIKSLLQFYNMTIDWKDIKDCPTDTPVLLLYYKHKKPQWGSGRVGEFITEGILVSHHPAYDKPKYKLWQDYTGRQLWDETSKSKNKVLGWTQLPNKQ